jgi:hypothetical protein
VRYQLVRDDDGHWYVIPTAKVGRWLAWLGSSDAEDGIAPDWAKEVGGSPSLVKFKEYEIG